MTDILSEAMRAVEAREQEDSMSEERIVPRPPREAVMDAPRVTGTARFDDETRLIGAPLPAFLDKGQHLRKPKAIDSRHDVEGDRTDALLAERGKVHGDWGKQAEMANHLRRQLHSGSNWPDLPPGRQEALDAIVTKLARIVEGDPGEPDHWDDLCGYARLGRG